MESNGSCSNDSASITVCFYEKPVKVYCGELLWRLIRIPPPPHQVASRIGRLAPPTPKFRYPHVGNFHMAASDLYIRMGEAKNIVCVVSRVTDLRAWETRNPSFFLKKIRNNFPLVSWSDFPVEFSILLEVLSCYAESISPLLTNVNCFLHRLTSCDGPGRADDSHQSTCWIAALKKVVGPVSRVSASLCQHLLALLTVSTQRLLGSIGCSEPYTRWPVPFSLDHLASERGRDLCITQWGKKKSFEWDRGPFARRQQFGIPGPTK